MQVHQSSLSNVLQAFRIAHRTPFTPTPEFYTEVGINRIRYSKLVRGKVVITGPEARALADFFEVPITDVI